MSLFFIQFQALQRYHAVGRFRIDTLNLEVFRILSQFHNVHKNRFFAMELFQNSTITYGLYGKDIAIARTTEL